MSRIAKKSESQKEADRKGAERIRRYELMQSKEGGLVDRKDDDDIKSTKFWQKIDDGEWEEKTYYYEVKKKK